VVHRLNFKLTSDDNWGVHMREEEEMDMNFKSFFLGLQEKSGRKS